MTLLVHPTHLPTRTTPVLLHYRDAQGRWQFATPDVAGRVRFEDATPAREIARYQDQENTPGLYWSATDGRHLEYESYLESQWMTMLDFDPDVVAMSAQPFRIQGLDSRGSWEHFPDLFVRLSDGGGRVVDVKNPRKVGDPAVELQAARTRELCEHIGFDYDFVDEPPLIPWLNVRTLAAYRRPFDLPPGLQDRVVAQARQPVCIGDLVAAFDVPEVARVAVLRACWFGALRFDQDAPLRDSTLVQASQEENS